MPADPSQPTTPLLRAAQLVIGHHGRALGAPLTLEIRAGEVLCLLGPNGCGKTTLFRTLLGLITPLGGTVEVQGRPLGALPRETLARQLAYVPQAQASTFAYTAEDVVLMGRAARLGLFSTPSAADRALASRCLQRLGLAALRQRPCTELSGGERQLVLIARALVQEAPLIVMDEPTASLDFGNQRRVLAEIRALADSGTTVLLSTHQPEHALRIADRVALMKGGTLLEVGPARAVMRPQALAELYGLEAEEIRRSIPGVGADPWPANGAARY